MIDRKFFYDKAKELGLLPSLKQAQVDSINCLLDEWEAAKVCDNRQLAYLLGTAYHETGHTMLPVTEFGSDAYLRTKKYWPFIGRGYVQLTWSYNYLKYGRLLGIDLLGNPDLAKIPKIAARIAVHGMLTGAFTGVALNKYFNNLKADWVNARRIINGTDAAEKVAGYAKKFYSCIKAI